MDLSKLPKLSSTRDHTPQPPGPASPQLPHDAQPLDRQPLDDGRRRYDDEGPLNFLDIFLAIGMGLLFMFMGMNYGRHLLGSTTAFPEVPPLTGTGFVWTDEHPHAGQQIPPEQLSPRNKEQYDLKVKNHQAQVEGRRLAVVSEASVFLVGAGLLVAGVAGFGGHLSFLPMAARRGGALLGIVATIAGMAYAVWAIAVMLRGSITPPLTMVAVLVAGLSLFMQFAALRSLTGGAPADLAGSAGFGRGPAPGAMPSPLAAAPGGQPAERKVHQQFAHQALRRAVLSEPAKEVGLLQGAGGGRYLRELWDSTCRTAGVDPQAAPPSGLEAEMTQVGPYSSVIVTMPPAIDRGDARFVGIVLRSYTRQDGAVIERNPLVLYYTLETDPAAGAEGKAVLCEWQGGDHVRFADRPADTFAAFREAMWSKVQARQDAEDRVGG